MQNQTRLSSRAQPFVPGTAKAKAPTPAQVVWQAVVLPVVFAGDWHEDSTIATPQTKRDMTKLHRGRSCTRDEKIRIPSRTPSPSGSVCLSEASTTVASWITKEDSSSDVSSPELQDRARESLELETVPVKNTFVHFQKSGAADVTEEPKKLSRCSSAPGALLSCAFQIQKPPSMEELHERRECTPCAYFAIKADGCRRGSECGFCHLCPADELKNRKKQKIKAIKEAKRERAALEALEAEFQY